MSRICDPPPVFRTKAWADRLNDVVPQQGAGPDQGALATPEAHFCGRRELECRSLWRLRNRLFGSARLSMAYQNQEGWPVMKRLLLATVALTVLAVPASAADMRAPVYKAPPPVYAFNWTGCYIGGNVGSLWARKEWTNATPGPLIGQAIGSHDITDWIGGVQGYKQ
jgi:hypothetical protein